MIKVAPVVNITKALICCDFCYAGITAVAISLDDKLYSHEGSNYPSRENTNKSLHLRKRERQGATEEEANYFR